jgi:hypothetical protein
MASQEAKPYHAFQEGSSRTFSRLPALVMRPRTLLCLRRSAVPAPVGVPDPPDACDHSLCRAMTQAVIWASP